MIGQNNVLDKINNLTQNDFPRFLIITGKRGQGKKYIANYIAKKLKFQIIKLEDVKIDTIRNIIELAYKQTEPLIYLIADADKMSIGAKNSLLKVIEEPPNNAYFIMTLQTMENTLPTIKSRCYELKMDNYTDTDITKFINDVDNTLDTSSKLRLQECCTNRYEVELFIKYGIDEFYSYAVKVTNNIYKVQSANAFKLAEKLDIKNDGNGYNIELFLQVVNQIYITELLRETDEIDYKKYGASITATAKTLQKLNITGINRQALIDMWILDIRKIWLN